MRPDKDGVRGDKHKQNLCLVNFPINSNGENYEQLTITN